MRVRAIFSFLMVLGCLGAFVQWASSRMDLHRNGADNQCVIWLTFIDGKKSFFPTGSACGNGFINCYKSLDGVQVCHSGGGYTGTRKRNLERVVAERNVIEKEPNLDEDGQPLGERILFAYGRKDRQGFAVCWTAGDSISCIDGDSLGHILSFEKQRAR